MASGFDTWDRRSIENSLLGMSSGVPKPSGNVSGRYRRTSGSPRPRLLQLCPEAEQGGLIAKAPNEVCSDGKILGVPGEGYRHRWLSGGVANRCKGDKCSRPEEHLKGIIRCGIDGPEGEGRFSQRRDYAQCRGYERGTLGDHRRHGVLHHRPLEPGNHPRLRGGL